ncbi:DUF6323 family protein [Eubacteriaceae bacterium ES3]|nr:DUF6323 family protein [Eubacteriaceae bacterium ES3]
MSSFLTFYESPSLLASNSKTIFDCNQFTKAHNLILSPEEAGELALVQQKSLKEHGRIDLSGAMIPKKIITVFSESPYLTPENYFETVTELIDIFYACQTETLEKFGDLELINIMKNLFDTICQGSLELLKDRTLYRLARKSHFSGMIDENDDC